SGHLDSQDLRPLQQPTQRLGSVANQVVARSPDLATSPTEGLQPRPRRETCGPAGPPERGGRGLETRAEQRDGGVWRPAPNSATAGSGDPRRTAHAPYLMGRGRCKETALRRQEQPEQRSPFDFLNPEDRLVLN